MERITERFRCDLCGRYSDLGVTETRAKDGQSTQICAGCLERADLVLLDETPREGS